MIENREKLKKVFCPFCRNQGRDKLLFQADSKTNGTIVIKCRGCKNLVKIELTKGLSV